MWDLFGNHIVGFPMRRLICCRYAFEGSGKDESVWFDFNTVSREINTIHSKYALILIRNQLISKSTSGLLQFYTTQLQTRNWLQAKLSVYPPQNYLELVNNFLSQTCRKFVKDIFSAL